MGQSNSGRKILGEVRSISAALDGKDSLELRLLVNALVKNWLSRLTDDHWGRFREKLGPRDIGALCTALRKKLGISYTATTIKKIAELLSALQAGRTGLIIELGDSPDQRPEREKIDRQSSSSEPINKPAVPPMKAKVPAKKAAKKAVKKKAQTAKPATKETPVKIRGRKAAVIKFKATAPAAKFPAAKRAEPKVKAAVEIPEEGILYTVWYATDRKPHDAKPGFGAGRAMAITYGTVDVWIPRAHRIGETGTGFLTKLLRRDLRDDSLRVQGISMLETDAFWSTLKGRLAEATRAGESHTLIFIHGYQVKFGEAAIRTAQLGMDLSINGAAVFYSWPSQGTLTGYPADEATIEASSARITRFLIDVAEQCGDSKIHIVAHSMGNRGLLRALEEIADNAETSAKVKFGQIMLAAPDVDRELFLQLSTALNGRAERVTLYSSERDKALWASKKFHIYHRAGYHEPYTCGSHFDTISVPQFNVERLGHSYFAKAKPLLMDMYHLIRDNASPPRFGMEKGESEGLPFWRIKK